MGGRRTHVSEMSSLPRECSPFAVADHCAIRVLLARASPESTLSKPEFRFPHFKGEEHAPCRRHRRHKNQRGHLLT